MPDDLRRRHGHWLNFIEFQFQGVLNTSPISPDFFLEHRRVLESSHAVTQSGPFRTKPATARLRKVSKRDLGRERVGHEQQRHHYSDLPKPAQVPDGVVDGVVGKDWESWRLDVDKLLGQATTFFFFVEPFFMMGCQKHAPNKLANSHLNGLNMAGWCGWWFSSFNYWGWFPQSYLTISHHFQKPPETNIFNTEPGTVIYYMRGCLHVSTIWEMAFIGCQVIPSLFLVLCPLFLRFLLAFLVFVSSFFSPFNSSHPSQKHPKTRNKQKKTPSKFPIP